MKGCGSRGRRVGTGATQSGLRFRTKAGDQQLSERRHVWREVLGRGVDHLQGHPRPQPVWQNARQLPGLETHPTDLFRHKRDTQPTCRRAFRPRCRPAPLVEPVAAHHFPPSQLDIGGPARGSRGVRGHSETSPRRAATSPSSCEGRRTGPLRATTNVPCALRERQGMLLCSPWLWVDLHG